MTTKKAKIVQWILAGLVGLIFIGSGLSKLFGGTEAAAMALQIGISETTLKGLGVIEVTGALLFLFPRTGVLGALILTAYMGGAIATHLTHGLSVAAPAAIEAIIWIAAVVRFPELKSRLLGQPTH